MDYPELRPLEGQYEVLAKIREGGMGAIFKVRHLHLDQLRVVKVMTPRTATSDENRKRFLREAQTATRLQHPNMVSFYDYLVDETGRAFMVMEYIDGSNLGEMIRQERPISISLALDVADQTLSALGYLHKKGIVHRDVSPDNVMVTRNDEGQPLVKLIDLGIAKMVDTDEQLTEAGVFWGKLRYSSPEQLSNLSGSAAIDGRSDLYSFGAVLYEALTGVCTFQGKTLPEIITAHVTGNPLPFEESDPAGRVSAPLRRVVLRALEVAPERRFQTAEEFRAALKALPEANASSVERKAGLQDLEGELAETAERSFDEATTAGETGAVPAARPKAQTPSLGLSAPPDSRARPAIQPTVLERTPSFAGKAVQEKAILVDRKSPVPHLPVPARYEGTEVFHRPSAEIRPRAEWTRRLPWRILAPTALVLLGLGFGLWKVTTTDARSKTQPRVERLESIPDTPRSVPTPGVSVPSSPSTAAETLPVLPPPLPVAPSTALIPPRARVFGVAPGQVRAAGARVPGSIPASMRTSFCAVIDRTSYQQGVVKEKPKGFAGDEAEAFRAPRRDSARITIEVAIQPERPLDEDAFTVVAKLINGGDLGVVVTQVEESAVREAGGFRPVAAAALPVEVEVGGALEVFRYHGILTSRSGFLKELRVTDSRRDSWKTTIRLVPCADR